MKKISAIILCFLVISIAVSTLFLSGCVKKEKEIKIGAILPLTGADSYLGESARKGMDLALDEINEQGGIIGKKVKIIYEDTQEKPELGVSAFRKLISVDKVSVVIGELASSVTLAVAPIAEENKVILLSPASTSPKITDAGDYIFRTCPSDIFEGKKMAEFIFSQGYKNIAILYVNNDYGIGLINEFQKKFVEFGGTILSTETFEQGSTDLRTSLLKIKGQKPEAIYLIAYPTELILAIKQAKELGINTQFLTSYEFENPEIIKILGELANGVIYTAYAYDPNKKENSGTMKFVTAFKTKYNEEPNIVAAMGYDATRVLAKAINDAKSIECPAIKETMYRIKAFQGVTGEITFDKNGDVSEKMLVIKTIKKQKPIYYEK